MTDNNDNAASSAQQAGALKSSLTVELHTLYAIRLWEGRKRQTGKNDNAAGNDSSVQQRRAEILSMPQVISRAGRAWQAAVEDNPYADAILLRLEESLARSHEKISTIVERLNHVLKAIPSGISITDVASSSPLNIGVFSQSPIGYRCVWLLVGYDQLALKAFQAAHYGLISRNERDQYLDSGGHAIRQVYAVIQPWRAVSVTRDDIEHRTARGAEAIERFGEPDPDILSGKRRSSFSPPLRQHKR